MVNAGDSRKISPQRSVPRKKVETSSPLAEESGDHSKEPLVKEKGAISGKTQAQATMDKTKDKPILPLAIDSPKEPPVKERLLVFGATCTTRRDSRNWRDLLVSKLVCIFEMVARQGHAKLKGRVGLADCAGHAEY